jgi:hypothetical protein
LSCRVVRSCRSYKLRGTGGCWFNFLVGVCAVGEVLGVLGASPAVAAAAAAGADVGGLNVSTAVSAAAQQLLQADDSGEQQGELADDQGLSGEQEEGAKSQRDQHTGLQQRQQQQGSDLLQLATGCK